MSKVLEFIKGIVPTVAILILAGVVAYDHLHKADPSTPVVAHDPAVIKLGHDYIAAFSAAGMAQLDAVGGGTFDSTADITTAQRAALDAGLKAAWAPVAAEATKRFGAVDASTKASTVEAAKAFYRDLAAGGRSKK